MITIGAQLPAEFAQAFMLTFARVGAMLMLLPGFGERNIPARARLVIALMLERHSSHARGAMRLLDDASAAIQHNRDLLQSAIDNVDQGLAVFEPGMTLISSCH
mgnify:CR=1 FL=1